MLEALRSASDDRLRQAFLMLKSIKDIESSNDAQQDELLKTLKGMLFVALYACIEHVLTNSVSSFLSHIRADPLPALKYKASLFPTILSREFNSVTSASKKTVWQKKYELSARIFSEEPSKIENDIFPAESTNISYNHFIDIWSQLGLSGDALPNGIGHWIVNEIKEHRNAIAHGREKASSIGSRFSVPALELKYRDVEAICENTIICFEEHIRQRSYLAAT